MVIRMHDPLQTVLAVQRALDGARRSDWFGTSTSGPGAFPLVNVFRKGDDFVVVAELPGVERDALDVQVKGRQVRLSGKRQPAAGGKSSAHRRERDYGEFDRTLSIPADIDHDAVKAEYHDGVLAVFLPRAEADKPRSIAIG